jgi:hypothetical protein
MKKNLLWPRPRNWENLWPALKGSLAKVYKPCIRPGCARCSSGQKHPAYILSFSQGGKRRCMYVPESLVPVFEKALSNGRRLEALLYNEGPRILKEFRRQRDADQKAEKTSMPSKPNKTPGNMGKTGKIPRIARTKS